MLYPRFNLFNRLIFNNSYWPLDIEKIRDFFDQNYLINTFINLPEELLDDPFNNNIQWQRTCKWRNKARTSAWRTTSTSAWWTPETTWSTCICKVGGASSRRILVRPRAIFWKSRQKKKKKARSRCSTQWFNYSAEAIQNIRPANRTHWQMTTMICIGASTSSSSPRKWRRMKYNRWKLRWECLTKASLRIDKLANLNSMWHRFISLTSSMLFNINGSPSLTNWPWRTTRSKAICASALRFKGRAILLWGWAIRSRGQATRTKKRS